MGICITIENEPLSMMLCILEPISSWTKLTILNAVCLGNNKLLSNIVYDNLLSHVMVFISLVTLEFYLSPSLILWDGCEYFLCKCVTHWLINWFLDTNWPQNPEEASSEVRSLKEYCKMLINKNEESDVQHSYMPYFIDLQLSTRSPYSATTNPEINFLPTLLDLL